MEIAKAIAEYQSALEAELKLAQQETVLKQKRTAAHYRLNMAKDELRAMELDLMETLNLRTV